MIMNKSKSRQIIFGTVIVLFTLYSLLLLYPFYYCINASLMDGARTFMRNQVAFANPVKFSNYVKAFQELEVSGADFFTMTFNSIWYAIGGETISTMFSAMTTYVVCKYKFKGRDFIYSLVIMLMMIPIYGALPARYRLYSQLGMVDSPLILIASTGGRGNFLVMYAFYKGISWEYAEAAYLDGATDWQIFTKIMFPMAWPAISVLYVKGLIGEWNDYSGPILWLPSFPTLSSGLFVYEKKIAYQANHPVYFAGVLISTIPVLTLFLIFQNTIMEKVHMGGLKG